MRWLLFLALLLKSQLVFAESYYAQLDDNNTVTRVVVIGDHDETDADGNPSEDIGVTFCQHLFNGGRWVKTFSDGGERKNYAGPGYKYDAGMGAFIPPQPYPSWTLDKDSANWMPPSPKPGGVSRWNEETKAWDVPQ